MEADRDKGIRERKTRGGYTHGHAHKHKTEKRATRSHLIQKYEKIAFLLSSGRLVVWVSSTCYLQNKEARMDFLYKYPAKLTQMNTRVLAARTPGTQGRPRNLFSAKFQNLEDPRPPYNAIRHTTSFLFRACLWLGSLLWEEYLPDLA